jgi:hypothetical protein
MGELVDSIRSTYRERRKRDFPPDLVEAARRELVEMVGRNPPFIAAWMCEWDRVREVAGTLGEPVEIVLVARAPADQGRFEVSVNASVDRYAARCLVGSPPPLDAPPAHGEKPAAFVRCGVIPWDRILVVTRILVTGHAGGDFAVRLRPGDNLPMPSGAPELVRAFEGVGKFNSYALDWLTLSVQGAAVGLRVEGRLATREEAMGIASVEFRWIPKDGDGLLHDGTVVLEVAANHGGGHDEAIRLDGSMDRIDGFSADRIFGIERRGERTDKSTAHAEGTGIIPTGKAFCVTRIDFRVDWSMCGEYRRSSRFRIRFNGQDLVEIKGSDPDAPEAGSTGEFLVRRGEEHRLEISCAMYAIGEALVHGTLVDDPAK